MYNSSPGVVQTNIHLRSGFSEEKYKRVSKQQQRHNMLRWLYVADVFSFYKHKIELIPLEGLVSLMTSAVQSCSLLRTKPLGSRELFFLSMVELHSSFLRQSCRFKIKAASSLTSVNVVAVTQSITEPKFRACFQTWRRKFGWLNWLVG